MLLGFLWAKYVLEPITYCIFEKDEKEMVSVRTSEMHPLGIMHPNRTRTTQLVKLQTRLTAMWVSRLVFLVLR